MLLSQLSTESSRVLCLLPLSRFSSCCCRSSSAVSDSFCVSRQDTSGLTRLDELVPSPRALRGYSAQDRHRAVVDDTLLPLHGHQRFLDRHPLVRIDRGHPGNHQEPVLGRHAARHPTPSRIDVLPHLLCDGLVLGSCWRAAPDRSAHPVLRQTGPPRIDSSLGLESQGLVRVGRVGNAGESLLAVVRLLSAESLAHRSLSPRSTRR